MNKVLQVTKPGIIFGNMVTMCGGFFLASHRHFDFWLLIVTFIGMALVIACGCIINNIIDSDIDSLMERTKNRVMVKGGMTVTAAIVYAIFFGILGFFILYTQTNTLTTLIALIGLFFYVVVYTFVFKRSSVYGTVVGGVSGAVPPLVGYCAVTNTFDSAAFALFMILFLWQIPHFYAIAIYRLNDYSNASIPVLPVKKGVMYTKLNMLVYLIAFVIAAIMPTVLGYAGKVYFFIALALGMIWLFIGLYGLIAKDDRKWARQMFLFSIILITVLSFSMI